MRACMHAGVPSVRSLSAPLRPSGVELRAVNVPPRPFPMSRLSQMSHPSLSDMFENHVNGKYNSFSPRMGSRMAYTSAAMLQLPAVLCMQILVHPAADLVLERRAAVPRTCRVSAGWINLLALCKCAVHGIYHCV